MQRRASKATAGRAWLLAALCAVLAWVLPRGARAGPEEDAARICDGGWEQIEARPAREEGAIVVALLERLDLERWRDECTSLRSALEYLARVEGTPPGAAQSLLAFRDGALGATDFSRRSWARRFLVALLNLASHAGRDEGEAVAEALAESYLDVECIEGPRTGCVASPFDLAIRLARGLRDQPFAQDQMVPALAEVASSPKVVGSVREELLATLAVLGGDARKAAQHEAVAALVPVFEQSNGNGEQVRAAAIEAIGSLDWRGCSVADELRAALVERIARARAYPRLHDAALTMAAEAMADYEPGRDRPLALALLDALDDPPSAARAAEGIARIATPDDKLGLVLLERMVARRDRWPDEVRSSMYAAALRQGIDYAPAVVELARAEEGSNLGAMILLSSEPDALAQILAQGHGSAPVLLAAAHELVDLVEPGDARTLALFEELAGEAPNPEGLDSQAAAARQRELSHGLQPLIQRLERERERPHRPTSGTKDPPPDERGSGGERVSADEWLPKGSKLDSRGQGGSSSPSREPPSENRGELLELWRSLSEGTRGTILTVASLAFVWLILFVLLWVAPRTLHRIERVLWIYRASKLPFLGKVDALRTRPLFRTLFFDARRIRKLWVRDVLARKPDKARELAGCESEVPELVVEMSTDENRTRVFEGVELLVRELSLRPRGVGLYGNALTGKSAIALGVAEALLAGGKSLPIHLELSNWSETKDVSWRSILDYLERCVDRLAPYVEADHEGPAATREFVRALIRGGQVVLILDGVDARHDEVAAMLAEERDAEQEREHPRPRLLVVSRRAFDDALLGLRVRVRELDERLWPKLLSTRVDLELLRELVGTDVAPLGLLAVHLDEGWSGDLAWDSYLDGLVAPLPAPLRHDARERIAELVFRRCVEGEPDELEELRTPPEGGGRWIFSELEWALDHSLFDIRSGVFEWRLPGLETHLLATYLGEQLEREEIDPQVEELVRSWLGADEGSEEARRLARLEDQELGERARARLAGWREPAASTSASRNLDANEF